jgi:hypothetical protein
MSGLHAEGHGSVGESSEGGTAGWRRGGGGTSGSKLRWEFGKLLCAIVLCVVIRVGAEIVRAEIARPRSSSSRARAADFAPTFSAHSL